MDWSNLLELLLPLLSTSIIFCTVLFEGQVKRKNDHPKYSYRYPIINITPWGWVLVSLLISLNLSTTYVSKEQLRHENKIDSTRHTGIINKLNTQILSDSIKILKDSIRIANLKNELNKLETYIYSQQLKDDSTHEADMHYLFKQLKEENVIIAYKTLGANITPSIYHNTVSLIPLKSFFIQEYIHYNKSLEVASFLTDYLNIINQYNDLFKELNIIFTDDMKMYENNMTDIQRKKIDGISKALHKVSYPINLMLKESSNIKEFDIKISKHVNKLIKRKKEKGIPTIKDFAGHLLE